MGIELTYKSYKKLIDQDIEYILKHPRTLERDHIIEILNTVVDLLYPKSMRSNKPCSRSKEPAAD